MGLFLGSCSSNNSNGITNEREIQSDGRGRVIVIHVPESRTTRHATRNENTCHCDKKHLKKEKKQEVITMKECKCNQEVVRVRKQKKHYKRVR